MIVIINQYCGEERNIEKLTSIKNIEILHTKTTNFYKSDFNKIKNKSNNNIQENI